MNEAVYHSRHQPLAGQSAFGVYQVAMLDQLAWAALLVLVLALGRMVYGKEVLWFSTVGLGLALLLAHILARIQLRAQWAQLVVAGPAFTLYSLHDSYFARQAPRPFPLAYAQASYGPGSMQLHYHDRVITLYARDWPQWQAILLHFQQAPPPAP